MAPDPAPSGGQQREAERQEQPPAGARHGPGGGRRVAPGTGLGARSPLLPHRGRVVVRVAGGYLRPGTWGWQDGRKVPGVGEGAASEAQAQGRGEPGTGTPHSRPAPSARGQRLKINPGRTARSRTGEGKKKKKKQGKRRRRRGRRAEPRGPASLPGLGHLDFAPAPDADPWLEPARASADRPSPGPAAPPAHVTRKV